jgi:hypothetical protein
MPSEAPELSLLALAVLGLLARARNGRAGHWRHSNGRARYRRARSGRARYGRGSSDQPGYAPSGYLSRFARPPSPDDAWASVKWAYSSQPDGLLPIGVVRVYNPAAAPLIVSVSVGTDAGFFARFPLLRNSRSPLSVRALRVGRRLRPANEPLLGVVSGGGTGCWEVPLGSASGAHSLVVKVRVDQAALRSRLFTWRLCPSAMALARTPVRDLVRR